MIQIVLFAMLCAFCTMVLIAPIAMSKKGVSYLIIFIVPALSLSLYMAKGAPGLSSQPALYDTNDERIAMRNIVRDEMDALRAVYENPEDKEAIMYLAGVQIAQTKFGEAISYLENALVKWEDDPDLKLQLSAAYFANGLLLVEKDLKQDSLQSLYDARRLAPEKAPFLPDLKMFIQELEKMNGIEPSEPEPELEAEAIIPEEEMIEEDTVEEKIEIEEFETLHLAEEDNFAIDYKKESLLEPEAYPALTEDSAEESEKEGEEEEEEEDNKLMRFLKKLELP